MTVTVTGGSIENPTMAMTADARTYSGTVSGMIRNGTGQAVAGCFVGLYQGGNGSERAKKTAGGHYQDERSGKISFWWSCRGENTWSRPSWIGKQTMAAWASRRFA